MNMYSSTNNGFESRQPTVIKGGRFQDQRGILRYNNNFTLTDVRRFYTIQNADTTLIRAWQGHRIEQRWFTAIAGGFTIKLIQVDNWDHPSAGLPSQIYHLQADTLDVLHVPPGYVSSIQAIEDHSILLVFADHDLGTQPDNYRFPSDYFYQ